MATENEKTPPHLDLSSTDSPVSEKESILLILEEIGPDLEIGMMTPKQAEGFLKKVGKIFKKFNKTKKP